MGDLRYSQRHSAKNCSVTNPGSFRSRLSRLRGDRGTQTRAPRKRRSDWRWLVKEKAWRHGPAKQCLPMHALDRYGAQCTAPLTAAYKVCSSVERSFRIESLLPLSARRSCSRTPRLQLFLLRPYLVQVSFEHFTCLHDPANGIRGGDYVIDGLLSISPSPRVAPARSSEVPQPADNPRVPPPPPAFTWSSAALLRGHAALPYITAPSDSHPLISPWLPTSPSRRRSSVAIVRRILGNSYRPCGRHPWRRWFSGRRCGGA